MNRVYFLITGAVMLGAIAAPVTTYAAVASDIGSGLFPTATTLATTTLSGGTPDGHYLTLCGMKSTGAGSESVTLGGTPMTQIGASTITTGVVMHVWGLLNVATTSSLAAWSSTVADTGVFACWNLTGANSVPATADANSVVGTGGSLNAYVSSTNANSYVAAFVARVSPGNLTAGANTVGVVTVAASAQGFYASTLNPQSASASPVLAAIINSSASTTLGSLSVSIDPYVGPDMTATSTLEQAQTNLFNGFVVFFASFFGVIWLLRKH